MSELIPESCPFCSMPPGRIIESSDRAFVVPDAFPVSSGHTLVVARRHVADIFELTDEEITEIIRLIQSARKRIDETLKPSGYNVGVNIGKAAGQTVMHVHVHLIPRYAGDTPDPTGGVRHVIPGKARYGEIPWSEPAAAETQASTRSDGPNDEPR
jgi:diadenosine tetraphosphate (Ap4A) HIT family hydrolase